MTFWASIPGSQVISQLSKGMLHIMAVNGFFREMKQADVTFHRLCHILFFHLLWCHIGQVSLFWGAFGIGFNNRFMHFWGFFGFWFSSWINKFVNIYCFKINIARCIQPDEEIWKSDFDALICQAKYVNQPFGNIRSMFLDDVLHQSVCIVRRVMTECASGSVVKIRLMEKMMFYLMQSHTLFQAFGLVSLFIIIHVLFIYSRKHNSLKSYIIENESKLGRTILCLIMCGYGELKMWRVCRYDGTLFCLFL